MSTQLFPGSGRLHLVIPTPYDSIRTDDVRDDLSGILVWISTTDGFDPSVVSPTEYGPSTSISLEGLADNTTYFVRYALQSKIDPSTYSISAQISATTLSTATSIYGYLTNSPTQVVADQSGNVSSWTSTTGVFKVYQNTLDVTGNGVAYYIDTTSITGGLVASIDQTTGVYSVSSLAASSGSVLLKANYAGTTVEQVLVVTKSLAGKDAALLQLTTTSNEFVYKDQYASLSTSPSVVITANLVNVTGTVTYSANAFTNTGTLLGVIPFTQNGNSITITAQNFHYSNTVGYVEVSATLGTLTDTVRIHRINGGSEQITVFLSNPTHTIPATALGETVADNYIGSGTSIVVKEGATVLQVDSSGAVDTAGSWNITSISSNGITPDTTPTVSTGVIIFDQHSNMTADQAYIDYTISYITSTGKADTVTVRQSFSKSKAGISGASSINATLSNDSHVLPASTTGAVSSYTGSGTQIRVYEGATELSYDGVGTSNGTWKAVVTTATNITAGSFTDSGTYLTVGDHSGVANGTDTASILYTITGKNASGTSFTITKTQTFSKSKTGISGTSPLVYDIVTSAPVITKDASDAATSGTHSSITIQGKKYDGSTTSNYGWVTVTGNGDTEDTAAINTAINAHTLTPTNTAGKTSYTIKLYNQATVSGATLLDTQVVSVVFKGATGDTGASSINATLSNDSHVLPASTTGAVSSYTGSGTQIRVYEGATELSYDGVGTSNGTWKAVVTTATNITAGSFTDSGTYLTVGDHSGVANGTDTASILYTITGKNASGTSFTITKTQTFSKSKTGISGTSPLVYDIVTSAPVITKDASDAATSGTHSSITIQGKKYDGSTTSNYGWVTVTGNGDTEATTAINTATTAYPLAPTTTAGKTSYTIKLYNQANVSGATLLDTQVVSVVFKGATGATGSSAVQIGFTRPVEVVTTDQYGSIGSITWPTGNSVYIIEGSITKAVGTSSITAAIVTTGDYANPQHGITLSIDASGNISYSAPSWTPVNNSTEFKIGLTYNSVTYYGYLRLNRAKASDRGSLSITKTISAVTGASSGIFKYPGRASGKAAWTSGTSAAAPVYSETYAGYVDTEATKAICDALGYTTSTTYLKIGDSANLVSPGTITTPSSTTAIVTTDTDCLGLAEINNILVALTNNGSTSTVSYSSNSDYTAWTGAKYGVPGSQTDAVFIGSGFTNLKKLGGYIVAYNSYATGNAGKMIVSTNGIDWYDAVAPADNIVLVPSACYGAGKIALVYRIGSTTYVGFTKDFSSWTLSSGFSNTYVYSIAYSPKHNRYVMGTANGVILYSDINSESTWTSLTNTDTKIGNSLVSKIAYGNGIFVAVPENQKIVVSYTGGTSWELGNTGNVVPSGTIRALEFINNQFVLSLYSTSTIEQKIYTSPDGMVWTNVINTSNGAANAIIYSENRPDKVLFGTYAPTGQSYSALTVATMTPKLSIEGYWDGTKWAAPGTYIDGNLLVKGSVAADAIAANTITGDKIFANSISADKISSSSNVGADGTFNLDVSSESLNGKLAIGQFTCGSASKFAITGLSLNSASTASGVAGGAVVGGSGLAAFNAKNSNFSTFNSALTLGNSGNAGYLKRHRDAGSQLEYPLTELSICTTEDGIQANYYGSSGTAPRLTSYINNSVTMAAGVFRYHDTTGTIVRELTVSNASYAAQSLNGKIYSALGYSPFTGIHDGLIDVTNTLVEPGDIIVDVEVLHRIDISNSIVKMQVSNLPNQKGVVGVCNTIFDEPPSDWYQNSDEYVFKYGMDEDVSLRPPVPAVPNPGAYTVPEVYKVIHVNALGEGLINVCGLGGNIETGDLIVTSSVAGKGMKQSDDIVRSITVAKSRETVVFDYPEQTKQIACIYLCG